MKKGIALCILFFVSMISVPMYMMLGIIGQEEKNVENISVVEEDTNKTIVVVDIGHGGDDNGTINSKFIGNVLEKDVNLEIGTKLVNLLKEVKDVEVVATRTTDKFISLSERANIGNDYNADIFISIHCNASENSPSTEGIETYYYNEDNSSKELAKYVQDNLIRYLNKTDRGVKRGNYQVLRESKNTAILVECGFLTNSLEREQLTDSTYQDILSNAIARGVVEYIESVNVDKVVETDEVNEIED